MRERRLRLDRMGMVLAGLPVYALLAFYAFVAAWRVQLGLWPRYGHPDAGAFRGTALVSDVLD
jgi:hypothetical protein